MVMLEAMEALQWYWIHRKFLVVRSLFFTAGLIAFPLIYILATRTAAGSVFAASIDQAGQQNSFDDPNYSSLFMIQGEANSNISLRYHFRSYEEYVRLQLNKTTNSKLRKIWLTTEWQKKVRIFSAHFKVLLMTKDKLITLRPGMKALCIGARVGQEVWALRQLGLTDSIGIDLVPSPPLVLKGDIHRHPFQNNTFDFEFSNVFDHALFPAVFVSEIERTLKPGGVAVIHVCVSRHTDKYSANDLSSLDAFLALFQRSELVHVKTIDLLGLDTEVAIRKHYAEEI